MFFITIRSLVLKEYVFYISKNHAIKFFIFRKFNNNNFESIEPGAFDDLVMLEDL